MKDSWCLADLSASFLRGKALSLLFALVASIACQSVCGAPDISATLQDTLSGDTDSDGKADPGETLTYTLILSNTGTMDATGVILMATPDLNTVLNGASISSTPIGLSDSYDALGHVTLVVNATDGVLANDFDPDGDPLAVAAFDSMSALGGTVALNLADGSFDYIPPSGISGVTDTFTYTLVNGLSPATVSIAITSLIWFVDNTAAPGGNGTLAAPFDTLAAAEAASLAGDTIFVFEGDGTDTGQDAGITLKNDQRLIGQGVALVVASQTIVPASGNPVISNGAGNGVTLAADNTAQGLTLSDSAGNALAGTNFGTLTLSNIIIDNPVGGGLDLVNGTADATIDGITTTNSGSTGINLNTFSGTLIVNGGSITNPGGTAFNINSSNGDVTYNGTITDDQGALVTIANCGGGTKTFTGAITDGIDGDGNGISLTNNTGTTINFDGGLTLSTGANAAFTATGGGTVNVTGTNTLATTTGTALNVANTTIGVSGLTFQSISANGANNGIVLNDTGATAGLTVTGTGGAGTGGTIQNGATGISLTSAQGVSLNNMQLNDFSDIAIRGSSVVGFTLDNTVVNGTNGNDAAADEGSVRFTELTGAATISNSTISGAVENNFSVINTSGTLNRITFDNTTFGPMSAVTGNDGLVLETLTGAVINATIQNCFFTHAAGDLFNFLNNGTAVNDLVFTGNTLTNAHPAIATGGGGVTISGGDNGGSLTFDISDNTFRDADGHAVLIVKSTGAGSYSGTFDNNAIGVAGTANSGSIAGSGLKVQNAGLGAVTISITDNAIRQYNNFGIELLTGGGAVAQSGNLNATITGNTVANPGTGGLPMNGIHLNGGTVPGDTYQICTTIGGAGALANNITGSGANGGTDFRLRQRQSTTVRLPGYAGANNDDAAVVVFVASRNGGASGLASNNVAGGGGGFVGGGSSCP